MAEDIKIRISKNIKIRISFCGLFFLLYEVLFCCPPYIYQMPWIFERLVVRPSVSSLDGIWLWCFETFRFQFCWLKCLKFFVPAVVSIQFRDSQSLLDWLVVWLCSKLWYRTFMMSRGSRRRSPLNCRFKSMKRAKSTWSFSSKVCVANRKSLLPAFPSYSTCSLHLKSSYFSLERLASVFFFFSNNNPMNPKSCSTTSIKLIIKLYRNHYVSP